MKNVRGNPVGETKNAIELRWGTLPKTPDDLKIPTIVENWRKTRSSLAPEEYAYYRIIGKFRTNHTPKTRAYYYASDYECIVRTTFVI